MKKGYLRKDDANHVVLDYQSRKLKGEKSLLDIFENEENLSEKHVKKKIRINTSRIIFLPKKVHKKHGQESIYWWRNDQL